MADSRDVNVVKADPVNVKDNEIVGRRLERSHIVFDGDKVIYLWKAFYDSRVETDLSVDNVGQIGNDKVSRKLIAEASVIARKDFELEGKGELMGWAGLKGKSLKGKKVVRTPVTPEKRPENPNPHHCEIVRDQHRNREAARSLAYELMFLAQEDNLYIKPV